MRDTEAQHRRTGRVNRKAAETCCLLFSVLIAVSVGRRESEKRKKLWTEICKANICDEILKTDLLSKD